MAILFVVAAALSGSESDSPPLTFKLCPCMNCQQRAAMMESLASKGNSPVAQRGYASPPVTAAPEQDPLPRAYTFWPQAGNLGGDLCITNYVDLTHGKGQPLDWKDTEETYSGHTGIDCVINSFNAQALGVPIYAALDGVVTLTHDGEIDTNTVPANVPANYVVLWHGNTHYTIYYHMKKGSVAVAAGQYVRAGTVIGFTGSSGSSSSPHLHFESIHGDGSPVPQAVYEPFAGAARPGPSYWADQAAQTQPTAFVRDVVLSAQPLPTYQDDAQRTGTFSAGLRSIYFNFRIGNVPANSNAQLRIYTPAGTLLNQFSHTLNPFGGRSLGIATDGYESKNNYTQPGTWTVSYDLNGQTVVTAPFQIVAGTQIQNAAPAVLTAVFDPASPNAGDVVFCRITGPALNTPAYQQLTYHYVWRVNGTVAREAKTAALSDALPAGAFVPGDALACSVSAVAAPQEGPVTVLNATISDALPALKLSSVFAPPGSAAATFTVTLSRPSAAPVSVDFATVDGTALAGTDYPRATGRLRFPPNTTTQQISVPLLNNGTAEKAFSLYLLNPESAWLSAPRGVCRLNSSAASASEMLAIDSCSAMPNPATAGEAVSFSATAFNPNGDVLSWNWDFGDGTSAQGSTASKIYTAPGAYTVRVTASNGSGTASYALPLQVDAALKISKVSLSFNFSSRGNDAFLIQGNLPASSSALPSGTVVRLTLNNYTIPFALGKSGQQSDRLNGKQFSLSGVSKKNALSNASASFVARVRKQDLFAQLTSAGFDRTAGTKTLTLPLELTLGASTLRQNVTLQYTVHAGASGARTGTARLAP